MSVGSDLRLAAFRGQEARARLLLDGEYKGETYNLIGGVPKARIKAPVDVADSLGRTALWYAAKAGHAPMVRMLMERGASVNAADSK
eukprot:SAG22_NODE_12640_length_435_cov_0.610119_1_plen_86_part_01